MLCLFVLPHFTEHGRLPPLPSVAPQLATVWHAGKCLGANHLKGCWCPSRSFTITWWSSPDLLLGIGFLDSVAHIVCEQGQGRPALLHCLLLPEGASIKISVFLNFFKGERYWYELSGQTEKAGVFSEKVSPVFQPVICFLEIFTEISCFLEILLQFLS